MIKKSTTDQRFFPAAKLAAGAFHQYRPLLTKASR
jgi:hypothetical protein